ncbi:septum site-determining protein MinC [Anaerospora hongkongensis]|uniref:septum site-determining protein MinC n=1 Tax=Anaerospora hongkongensis TaxID=244830 RepID=UPI00289C09A7|nr:septum site-determining protein MinC [Anaerospora hongkongensis]
MQEAVMFKGNRDGIRLIINQSVEFGFILNQLKAKLDEAADFFTAGTTVKVPAALGFLSGQQREELAGLLAHYGLQCAECSEHEGQDEALEVPAYVPADMERHVQETLIVPRTLRGGQKLIHDGAVIIDGDVNPGAEVIAGGNITVLGTCRGIAHAGAYGNQEATITAKRLMASQLRIAGLIARAPDHPDVSTCAETARIDNQLIIIEPAILGEEEL